MSEKGYTMGMLSGREPFTDGGRPTELTVTDYWSFQHSNIDHNPEYVAEFLVAKSLGKERPDNDKTWTLFDITYRGKRIEVKETSFWHPLNEPGKVSNRRSFSIQKVRGYGEVPVRNNDIYVFCLLTGETPEEAWPLELSHWEFYVVRTNEIDELFGDQRSVALSRIRKICHPVPYARLRDVIDAAIDAIETYEQK